MGQPGSYQRATEVKALATLMKPALAVQRSGPAQLVFVNSVGRVPPAIW